MFNQEHIFDENTKQFLKTSVTVVAASITPFDSNRLNQICALQMNFINQYSFISIGQLLARSLQIFDQDNINSNKTRLSEGKFMKHCISESQSCLLYFGKLLGYALLHVANQLEFIDTSVLLIKTS